MDEAGAAMNALRVAVALVALAPIASAHVGSPDVYFEGQAGPYALFVTIRPPLVIPGVASVEIRGSSPGLKGIRVMPLPLAGQADGNAPTPDVLEPSKQDPQFFSGNIWIMRAGSWQVRIQASGGQGEGLLSVPVPAAATRTKTMDLALGSLLLALMLVLALGIVSIAGAGVREARLEPGAAIPPEYRKRGRIAMAVAAIAVAGMILYGNSWWTSEASDYSRYIYKPLRMETSLQDSKLILLLSDPGWIFRRRLDNLVPDHNHVMHLFVIRWPQMDRVWHLHPAPIGTGRFRQQLPDLAAGDYKLYADVVHSNGFPETPVVDFHLPSDVHGQPLTGDDAAGSGPPLEGSEATVAQLPDGWRMIWDRDPAPLIAKKPTLFRFHLEDANGAAARDLELYMGMAGHAAFVRSDGAIFAHIHPSGTVAMPALALANPSDSPHDMHGMMMSAPGGEVSFPYGFPEPGTYRIVVQMKRAGKVETGMFAAVVANSSTATPPTASPRS